MLLVLICANLRDNAFRFFSCKSRIRRQAKPNGQRNLLHTLARCLLPFANCQLG